MVHNFGVGDLSEVVNLAILLGGFSRLVLRRSQAVYSNVNGLEGVHGFQTSKVFQVQIV